MTIMSIVVVVSIVVLLLLLVVVVSVEVTGRRGVQPGVGTHAGIKSKF